MIFRSLKNVIVVKCHHMILQQSWNILSITKHLPALRNNQSSPLSISLTHSLFFQVTDTSNKAHLLRLTRRSMKVTNEMDWKKPIAMEFPVQRTYLHSLPMYICDKLQKFKGKSRRILTYNNDNAIHFRTKR